VEPQKRNRTVLLIFLGLASVCLCVPILAAILFPVFSQARQAAQRTTAMGKFQRIAAGLLVYAANHDDRLPPLNVWSTAATNGMSIGEQKEAFRFPGVPEGETIVAMNAELNARKVPEKPKVLLFEVSPRPNHAMWEYPSMAAKPGLYKKTIFVYTDGTVKATENW
jgi:Tfp pilus assembly protein PilE